MIFHTCTPVEGQGSYGFQATISSLVNQFNQRTMRLKLFLLTLGLLMLGSAAKAQWINSTPTRLFTPDSVGRGIIPRYPLHILGDVNANSSLAHFRASTLLNGGSVLTLEAPPIGGPGGPLLGNHNLLQGVVNDQVVARINRLGNASFNGTLNVGSRAYIDGNTRITGEDNDGQTAALEIRSENQRMLLDGNEIDGITDGLYLNNNTTQNVFITRGGGRTLFGAGSNPTAKVEIRHNSTYGNPALEITEESTDYARIYFRNATNNSRRFNIGGNPGAADPQFNISYNEGDGTVNILVVDGDDRSVGIGTSNIPEGYRLAVDGRLIAEEVRVELSQNWPDYVFEEGYVLMTLDQVKDFILQYKHLPGFPSAKTIGEKGGFDLGEIQRLSVEKIEEMYLHLFNLQAKNEAQDSKIQSLEAELKSLKAEMESMKKWMETFKK